MTDLAEIGGENVSSHLSVLGSDSTRVSKVNPSGGNQLLVQNKLQIILPEAILWSQSIP